MVWQRPRVSNTNRQITIGNFSAIEKNAINLRYMLPRVRTSS